MKSTILLTLSLLTLVGCQKTSTTKNTTTNTNNVSDCTQNPMNIGCPQFCVQYPTATSCSGTTAGTTGGSYPGQQYQIIPPSDNNWTAMYPTMPTPNNPCSTPTGTGYDLRKGTITLAGGMMYAPYSPWTSLGDSEYTGIRYSHNTSSFFSSNADSAAFLDTDAKLRVRFKIRPQPKPPVGKTWCLGRVTGQSSNTYGYRTLEFKVGVRGLNSDGSLKPTIDSVQSLTGQINGCSSTVDFSGVNQNHPYGMVLVVFDVYSDQGCWYSGNCTSMTSVKTGSCWSMDIEASVDGTKNI